MIRALTDNLKGKVPWGSKRSNQWATVRENTLKLFPACMACGGTKKLEVHHIKPFHLTPELELDPTNLIVLCESGLYGINCHLSVGHLGSFKSYNVSVRRDASRVQRALKGRP